MAADFRRTAILMCCFSATGALAVAGQSCEDLLNADHNRPAVLEYRGCRQRRDLQGEPFEAKYRVRGRNAAQVETYLIRSFQVKEVVRTCCVWESTQNSYRDKEDRLFSITITTGENTVTNKADWPKISWFFVIVQRFRADP